MSDAELGGDPNGPQNLGKIFGSLKGMARELRKRKLIKARRNGHVKKEKQARQICDICTKPFDFAIIVTSAPIVGARCQDCKNMLANGYIACVALKGHAFVKPDPSKNPELVQFAGQVIRATNEEFDALQKKYASKTS